MLRLPAGPDDDQGDPTGAREPEWWPGLARASWPRAVVWACRCAGVRRRARGSSCGATSGRGPPIGDQVDQLRQPSDISPDKIRCFFLCCYRNPDQEQLHAASSRARVCSPPRSAVVIGLAVACSFVLVATVLRWNFFPPPLGLLE